MTQSTYTQSRRAKVASYPGRKVRTLAERRADFEAQMRECAASDGTMALTELSQVSARIKELRGRTDLTQYDAANKLRVPPRTYQSWENGEVETSRENYAKVGKLFGASVNWILFGQEEEPPMPSQEANEDPAVSLADLHAVEQAAIARHSLVMTELGKIRTLLEAPKTTRRPASRKRAGN